MLFVWFSNPEILTKLCMEICKYEKPIKKACNRHLCSQKLNKLGIVSLRYFYTISCSFSPTISFFNTISRAPRISTQNIKIFEKKPWFFSSKHHRIDRFPPNMILVQSRKIYESIEQKMLFLLVLVSAMLIIEIMNEFYIILKNTKKLQL